MWKYILKRLLMMVFVVLGVAIVIFSIMYFVPGNPAEIMLGATATDEQIAAGTGGRGGHGTSGLCF